ncbi:MAG: hypothetical protein ACE5JP_16575 [Candidatus Bipolaricaulia bacterium]
MITEERSEREAWEDWCQQDRVDAIGWAAAFIWGAVVLLVGNTDFAANSSWWDGWAVFFTGAGVITLVETAVRLLVPEYRRFWVRSLIFGSILLGIGLEGLTDTSWFWALVLFAIGIIILRGAFARRR